jgi:hypothetical protein
VELFSFYIIFIIITCIINDSKPFVPPTRPPSAPTNPKNLQVIFTQNPNTSRTPPTFKSAVATMEVQQKEYILSVSGRPLLPFPTTPCPSVDVLRFPSYDD